MNRRVQQAVESLIAARRTAAADPGDVAAVLAMARAEDNLSRAVDEEATGGRGQA